MILVLLITVSLVTLLFCLAVAPVAHLAWVDDGQPGHLRLRNVALALMLPAAVSLWVAVDFAESARTSDLNERRLEFPDFSVCEHAHATPCCSCSEGPR